MTLIPLFVIIYIGIINTKNQQKGERCMKKRISAFLVLVFVLTSISTFTTSASETPQGTVYEVGPGKAYESLLDIPWGSLMPGDTVKIYWREEPYREKFCISRAGTPDAPITITGVPGPEGQLPVISGENAVVSDEYSFWNDNRCVIKIGGARFPGNMSNPDTGEIPRHIIIENLDICSARPPYGGEDGYTYIDRYGNVASYSTNASAIYIEYGEDIIIRNNRMHDCGNGFFTASQSKRILVQGNHIYDNGIKGRILEHNIYTSSENIIFEYNYLGPLRGDNIGEPCGNNLKDRSAGTVIRYNMIVGGNRQLDLVDSGSFVDNPLYRKTYVYGNIIIDNGQGTNSNMIHYGGDSLDYSIYRKGTLYFYNNTVVNLRPGRQQIFQIDTDDEHVDARNNILLMTGEQTALVNDTFGTFVLMNNWINEGYRITMNPEDVPFVDITMKDNIIGKNLKFVDADNYDFRLLPGSSCVDNGTELHPDVLPDHDVLYQYLMHQSFEPRPMSKSNPVDKKIDIGAYELPSGRELGQYLKNLGLDD